jgi:hypothetical protein
MHGLCANAKTEPKQKMNRHQRLGRNSKPGHQCLGDLSTRRGQVVLKAKGLKFSVTIKYTVPTATYCPWVLTWLFSTECAVDLLESTHCDVYVLQESV